MVHGQTPTPAAAATKAAVRNLWPVIGLFTLSALWLAAYLASELLEGESFGFDAAILMALRRADNPALPVGPPWLLQSAIDISALGGSTLLWLIGLAGTIFLVLQGRRREAVWLVVSFAGSSLLNQWLKSLFHRARPALVPHLAETFSASFPSGHAMSAAAAYLTLAIMLAEIQPLRAVRLFLIAVATLLVVLIGCSRVFLGVHWPSDVIAGWCVGSAWAMAVYAVNHQLRERWRGQAIRQGAAR